MPPLDAKGTPVTSLPLRLRPVVVLGAAVALLAGAPMASAVAAPAPAAPVTAFLLEPAAGSWVLDSGAPISMTDPDVTATGTVDALTVATSGAHAFTAVIAAPTGQHLAVQRYSVSRFGDAADAGLDVSGDGRGCNATTGTLEIHELTTDAGTGQLTAFAATFTQSCDGGPANVGELRWNSSVPFEAFHGVRLDQTSAVHTVTYTAPAPTTVASTNLLGDTSAFEVTSDTCTGAVLDTGQSCAVGVVAHPSAREGTYAYLAFIGPGASALGRVSLTTTGVETAQGGYTSLTPARILDTRHATGITTKTPIAHGRTVTLQVTGKGGVPSGGVMAVVLNLTVVSPTSGGYLTAYPTGAARPVASSINVAARQVLANLVTVSVGSGGAVTIYNGAGSTHIVADVSGYYRSAASTPATDGSYGSYQQSDPWRAVDTRTAEWGKLPLASGEVITPVIDYGADANSHIRALAVNLTAVGAKSSGYLTAFNGQPNGVPATSSVNYTRGQTVANMAVVPVSTFHDPGDGLDYPQIGVLNVGGPVHVLVDIVGFFDDNNLGVGLRFHAMTPTRIVDTRAHLGTTALGAGVTRTVTAPGSVAGDPTYALVTNTAAISPTATTYLTLWAADLGARPGVSNLNAGVGQIVANMTMTGLGAGNRFNLFNAGGTTNVVVDVAGSLDLYPSTPPPPTLGAGPTLDLLRRTPSEPVVGLRTHL